jgi:uncharacterized OB-fold protein
MYDRAFTEESFQLFLSEGKLMGSRSMETGEVFAPPRPMCPRTFNMDMEWIELSGKGELAAYTAVYIGPTAMIDAGYDRSNPYCTGIVRLEEGPSISAQILGVDASQPQTIAIGTPLKVTFIERRLDEDNSRFYLAFTAENSGSEA